MKLGTSETIRLSSTSILFKQIEKEWLAGLIDGDGCFTLSKKGYAALEITMDLRDSHTLYFIKQKLGGSIKLRSGVKAIRYRLHHRQGMAVALRNFQSKFNLNRLDMVHNSHDNRWIFFQLQILLLNNRRGNFDQLHGRLPAQRTTLVRRLGLVHFKELQNYPQRNE